jgi:hypothetical protein
MEVKSLQLSIVCASLTCPAVVAPSPLEAHGSNGWGVFITLLRVLPKELCRLFCHAESISWFTAENEARAAIVDAQEEMDCFGKYVLKRQAIDDFSCRSS